MKMKHDDVITADQARELAGLVPDYIRNTDESIRAAARAGKTKVVLTYMDEDKANDAVKFFGDRGFEVSDPVWSAWAYEFVVEW